jgi:TusA-related sulfurtransferase
MTFETTDPPPAAVFDGGDLDCGSGLILLIRENMLRVPVDEILEMRSREPTVADDLPPWCRMVGHEYLGSSPGDGFVRYFIRRRAAQETVDELEKLAKDKHEARQFEWRARARSIGHQHSKVYARNFSFDVGQPASFEEKDSYPSAIEYLLGAVAASLTTGFASDCTRAGVEVDDIEISISLRLHNILAHLGVEEGDPSFKSIEGKCFVSTFEDEDTVRKIWAGTVSRSPLVATLKKGMDIDIRLAIV